MGRAPCCDKANVKKGPWSPEEDAKLKSYIEQHGTGGNWIALPQKIGLKRCGKSCRLRWLNYLRPNIKHGGFSEEEDNIICSLYISIGSRWSVIAAQLPGRTDNDIKNYWNTRLKKKLLGKQRKEQQARNKAANGVFNKRENNGRSTGNSTSLIPENSAHHQQPYWPQMPAVLPVPLPYTNQGSPSFNDQDSIRRFLIKLGGRFSDDYQPSTLDVLNFQFPNGDGNSLPSSTQQIIQEEQVHTGSSSCMNFFNNNQLQFTQSQTNQFCAEGVAGEGPELVQGQGSSTFTSATIGEMASTTTTTTNDYPQRWLEFYYGEDMNITDHKIAGAATICGQSSNWGETSSSTMIYPPLVASNYLQGLTVQQETPQGCVFQELSDTGAL